MIATKAFDRVKNLAIVIPGNASHKKATGEIIPEKSTDVVMKGEQIQETGTEVAVTSRNIAEVTKEDHTLELGLARDPRKDPDRGSRGDLDPDHREALEEENLHESIKISPLSQPKRPTKRASSKRLYNWLSSRHPVSFSTECIWLLSS